MHEIRTAAHRGRQDFIQCSQPRSPGTEVGSGTLARSADSHDAIVNCLTLAPRRLAR